MSSVLIQADNLVPLSDSKVIYPSLSLNVYKSSVISIIGPESMGKTLCLKTLNGFNAMAQGQLSLLSRDVRGLDRQSWLNLRKEVSYVGQDSALLSAYTLLENIILPALYHKLASREELTRQAHALLDEIGFDDKEILAQLPAFVSPLQNYYVMIVRALIVQPKLLFLDDVYAHLSLNNALNLKKFLEYKVDNTGLSIVSTTNNIKMVINDSTKIIFISSDRIEIYERKLDMLESDDNLIKEYLSRYDIH